MADSEEKIVTIDGVDYDFDKLTKPQQDLISVWSAFNQDLLEARVEVFKLEAAIRDITRTISSELKKPPAL